MGNHKIPYFCNIKNKIQYPFSLTEVCVKRMLSPWLYPELIYRRSGLFRLQQKVVGILFGFIEQVSCSSDR